MPRWVVPGAVVVGVVLLWLVRRHKRLLPVLQILGVLMVASGTYLWFTSQSRTPPAERIDQSQLPQAPEADPSEPQRASARPVRLVIPSIGVDEPVVRLWLRNGLWDADTIVGEVGHLEGTQSPAEGGNTVMAAHVTVPEGAYGPFKDLATVQPGDLISVWTSDRAIYTYEVVSNRNVPAEAVEVTFPTEQPTLTLLTCSGWDPIEEVYADRIVVQALLQDVSSLP